MRRKPLNKSMTLSATTEQMIADLRQSFSDAEFLIHGESYGQAEDITVKVFVRDEARLNEISDKAHELSLKYELATGYFIMPMTLPIACSPVKYESAQHSNVE